MRAECRRKCIEVFRLCVKGAIEYPQEDDNMQIVSILNIN